MLDLFSIPNLYIRKGRPHGHRYGKKEGDKEYHMANQLQKKCRMKEYKNIHDRFIRDLWFRKTMLELGRSEEVILEMDRLANEDHSHIATEEEIDVYRGNWEIRSNLVGSDTMPVRHRPDFKKALSTLHRLTKAEDKAYLREDVVTWHCEQPTASPPEWARVYCGLRPGPTRVMPPSRQDEEGHQSASSYVHCLCWRTCCCTWMCVLAVLLLLIGLVCPHSSSPDS